MISLLAIPAQPVLVLMRALGMFCFLPLSQEGGLWGQRLILAAAAAVFFWGTGGDGELSLSSVLVEFLVGGMISIPFIILISAAGVCGEFLDSVRGQSLGAIYDPLSGAAQSFSGVFGRAAAVACVLFAGGAEEAMRLFSRSLLTFPPGSHSTDGLAERTFLLITDGLSGSFQFFLPLAAVLLTVDAGCMLICKIVPALSVQGESFQLKTLFGGLAMYIFWKSGASLSIRPFLEGLR